MRRRRAKRGVTLDRGFADSLALVERAKEELVQAVPSARAPGRPLAESLLSFETALREARDAMLGWREDRVESERGSCREALDESLRLAEDLRRTAPALGFESLIATVADLIAPLEAFEVAEDRVRRLSGSG